MKRFLLALILLLSIGCLEAQTTTEKWSPVYQRWEYYDARGNMIGYKKKNMYGQWVYTDTQKNNQSTDNRNEPLQAYDMDFIARALAIKQQQYERQLELNRQNEAEKERIKRENALYMIDQINAYYKAANSYPQTVRNGWHNVYASNGYDFCEIRKVYVENNKITQYVVDDWNYRNIASTLPIKNGTTSITVNKNDMLTIVFLEYIYEPEKTIQPPKEAGSISFWHNKKGGGDTDIWVDGIYIGAITSYFNKVEPNCGQEGTLTFKYKPGTYQYEAQNNRNKWNGTITIRSGQCAKMLLNK